MNIFFPFLRYQEGYNRILYIGKYSLPGGEGNIDRCYLGEKYTKMSDQEKRKRRRKKEKRGKSREYFKLGGEVAQW
jgi:hypothetical protein